MADVAWVGRLGPEAIAAVSTSFFASWTLFAVGDVIVAGVTALVSQAIGARRDRDAVAISLTGFALALALGTAAALLGFFGAGPLFRALLDDPVVVELGSGYLSLFALLGPVFYVGFTAESVFRSCGDSRTPMLVLLAGTALNIVLDPFLILGLGPFPKLGVQGAAIATIVAECAVVAIYAALWARGRFPLALPLSRTRELFSGARARQMVRIGTPSALTGILYSLIYLVLARLAGDFGTPALAALGVVNRLESVNYLTAIAVGMGVATMVGQNLGAGRPDRAERCAHTGARLITWTTGTIMLAYLVVPEPIARLFTSDPEAVRESVLFLRIVAISQVLMGWELVYGQAFTGAGDTLPPMHVSWTTSAVRVPLAWWLAHRAGLGPAGIWWTISLTGVLRGLWLTLWFRTGRWRRSDWGLGAEPEPEPPARAPLGPEGPEG